MFSVAGALISLKEQKWAVAVEVCLGGLLEAFCVTSHRDERVLEGIMNQVFRGQHKPLVITSKFQVWTSFDARKMWKTYRSQYFLSYFSCFRTACTTWKTSSVISLWSTLNCYNIMLWRNMLIYFVACRFVVRHRTRHARLEERRSYRHQHVDRPGACCRHLF